jgi:hypothetical protein
LYEATFGDTVGVTGQVMPIETCAQWAALGTMMAGLLIITAALNTYLANKVSCKFPHAFCHGAYSQLGGIWCCRHLGMTAISQRA